MAIENLTNSDLQVLITSIVDTRLDMSKYEEEDDIPGNITQAARIIKRLTAEITQRPHFI